MTQLFCDSCGDIVKAVYPCKFVFHNGNEIPLNICPDCMENGNLKIDLARKRLISNILKRIKPKGLWRRRAQ